MNSKAEREITRQVLDSFQRELRGLRGSWFAKMFMGEPPAEGFARQFSEIDEKLHLTGSVRGVWRITCTEIVELECSFAIPKPGRVSKLYWEIADFDFVIAPDCSSVVVGSQVGPRFGSGVRFQVVTDGVGNLTLKPSDTLWKS